MLYLHGIGHFTRKTSFEPFSGGIGDRDRRGVDHGTGRYPRTANGSSPRLHPRDEEPRPRAAHEVSLYTDAKMAGSAGGANGLRQGGALTVDVSGLSYRGVASPATLTPAEAATVAAELGIYVPCFDLNSACTTFGMQLHFLSWMTADALPPFVLTVQPEGVTRAIDYSDRSSAVLFGDATTAAVVSTSVKARVTLVESNCGTKASSLGEGDSTQRRGHFRQDGHAVQGFAIRRMTESLQDMKGWSRRRGGETFPFHRPSGKPGRPSDRMRAGGGSWIKTTGTT